MTVVTVNLDEENVEWLDAETDNRSAFVNRLVTKAKEGSGEIDEAVAQFQREKLRRDREALEVQIEGIDKQLETIHKRMEAAEGQKEASLEASIDDLEGTPRDPTNPAIQTHAERLNMSPADLVEELEAHE